MPRFSDDDVLNFQVTEALTHVAAKAGKEADRRAKAEDFRKSHKKQPKAPSAEEVFG
jgi:hypothetical protein